MTKTVLIIWNGPPTGTSANLFRALSVFLAERFDVLESANTLTDGGPLAKLAHHIRCNARRLGALRRCDTVVVHSYAALSLPTVILARLLNRKVIVMHWDVYPTSIDGKRLGGRLRRLFDKIEWLTTRIATTIVIPSEDFRPFVHHRNLVVMPLWPSLPLGQSPARAARPPSAGPIRLAFAGQAGPTRGLADTFNALAAHRDTQFEVHLFGVAAVPYDQLKPAPNLRVIARGRVDREQLTAEFDAMDFGLISLNPHLDQPGFPSKVFDYVAADLPVVYFGRTLEAFVSLLERTGVGVRIEPTPVDWTMLRSDATARWARAKSSFEAETRLEWSRIEKIL